MRPAGPRRGGLVHIEVVALLAEVRLGALLAGLRVAVVERVLGARAAVPFAPPWHA